MSRVGIYTCVRGHSASLLPAPLGKKRSWIYRPHPPLRAEGQETGRYTRSQAIKGRLQIYQIKMQDPQLNLDF